MVVNQKNIHSIDYVTLLFLFNNEWSWCLSQSFATFLPCHSFVAILQLGLLDCRNSTRKCWNKLVARSWTYLRPRSREYMPALKNALIGWTVKFALGMQKQNQEEKAKWLWMLAGHKSRNLMWRDANANCPTKFCHVSKLQAPDYWHYTQNSPADNISSENFHVSGMSLPDPSPSRRATVASNGSPYAMGLFSTPVSL